MKEIREAKGISLAFVAKALNKSRQTLYDRESGKSKWLGIEVQKLCNLYGCDISEVKL